MKRSRLVGMALIMIGGHLTPGAAPLHAATFNVREYGAVADDATDNTAAFAKCMDAIIAAGGGRLGPPAPAVSSRRPHALRPQRAARHDHGLRLRRGHWPPDAPPNPPNATGRF